MSHKMYREKKEQRNESFLLATTISLFSHFYYTFGTESNGLQMEKFFLCDIVQYMYIFVKNSKMNFSFEMVTKRKSVAKFDDEEKKI